MRATRPLLFFLHSVSMAVCQSPTTSPSPVLAQWVVAQEFHWERFDDTQNTACRGTADLDDSSGWFFMHSAASLDECKAGCPGTASADCMVEFSVDPQEQTGYRCEVWVPATNFYATVSHVSQCWTRSRTPKSCDTVCGDLGKVCAQSELEALNVPNNGALLLAAFEDVGFTCWSVSRPCEADGNNCMAWGAPYLHSSSSVCFGGSPIASCSQIPIDIHHRRVCPCADDPNTCTGAGASAWGQCGGINWQQEQWCDGDGIECVPQVNSGVLNEYYYQCLSCVGDCCACGELRMNGACIRRSALERTPAPSTSNTVAVTTSGTLAPKTTSASTTIMGAEPTSSSTTLSASPAATMSLSLVATTETPLAATTQLSLFTTPVSTSVLAADTSTTPAPIPPTIWSLSATSGARLFIANIELRRTNVTGATESLQTVVGRFFSVSQDDVTCTENLTDVQANIDVTLFQDRDSFVSRIEETSRLLDNFLTSSSSRRLLVARRGYKVLRITATCGAGHMLSNNSCVACPIDTFKVLIDNSECLPCPARQTTNKTGSNSAVVCECREGYTKVAAGEDTACMSSLQYVSVEAAEEAATGISAAVGSVVATNIAIAVATSVASSVSSAVAVSSGGAVGGAMGAGVGSGGGGGLSGSGSSGSGSSGTLTLISHVQLLNQMGRIGGERIRSNSMKKFSEGFGWSNFDLGLKIGTQSRRAASNKGKAKQGENSEDGPSAEEEGIGTCSLEDIAPSLERLITCALAIFGVFFARNVAILVIQKCLRSDKAPEHLHFPAWEGPVILVQYLAICDSAFGAASLLCPSGISFGILILLMGPLAFLFVAVRFVSRHVTAGELSFEYSQRPSLSDLKGRLTAAQGIIAKVVTANAWYEGALARGSWEDSKASVWWGFLISDIVGTAWIYSAWLLVKKLWLTLVLNSVDGVANAVLAIIAQVVDTSALLYLRPFVDRKTDVTEIAGAVLNLLAFIAISLPTILGPEIPVPEFLGTYTTMILATLATVLAAAVSLMSPLALIVRFIFKACSFLPCVNFNSPSVVSTAYQASKADVTAGIKGEMQACVEEAYIPPEEDDEDTAMLWDDGTACHTATLAAVGAAGAATNPKTGSIDRGNPVEIEPMAKDTLKTPALITSNSFASKVGSPSESFVSPTTSQRGIRQIIWDSESAWSSTRTMRADDVNVLPSFPLNYAVGLPPSSMGRSPMVSNGSTPPRPLVIAPLPTSSPPSCSDGSGGKGANVWASATAHQINLSEGRTWPSMPDRRTFSSSYFSESSGTDAAAVARLGSLSVLNRASTSEIAPGVYWEARFMEGTPVVGKSDWRKIQ